MSDFLRELRRQRCDEAYNLGLRLGDFFEWAAMSGASHLSGVRQAYYAGVADAVKDDQCPFVRQPRTSIFIRCDEVKGHLFDTFDTKYISYYALEAMGFSSGFSDSSTSSGKFGTLMPWHGGFVLCRDNPRCNPKYPILRKVVSDGLCYMDRYYYSRPLCWAGSYFVVVSAVPFDRWAKACGCDGALAPCEYERFRSRFHVCYLEDADTMESLNLLLEEPRTADYEFDFYDRLPDDYFAKQFAAFRTEFNRQSRLRAEPLLR